MRSNDRHDRLRETDATHDSVHRWGAGAALQLGAGAAADPDAGLRPPRARGARAPSVDGIMRRISLSQSVMAVVRSHGAARVPRPGRLRYYARAMRTRSRKSSTRVT